MTEKPDQEFDPSKIPSFDPIQELKEKGQFHIKSDGTASMGKKETPAEKIEREERDASPSEAQMRRVQGLHETTISRSRQLMPENTWIYDTVYEEFREELQFTDDEMSEMIMFNEDRSLFDELMYRVKRRKWED